MTEPKAETDALAALVADLAGTALGTDAGQELRVRLSEALGLWTPEDAIPYAVRAALNVVADVLRGYVCSPGSGVSDA